MAHYSGVRRAGTGTVGRPDEDLAIEGERVHLDLAALLEPSVPWPVGVDPDAVALGVCEVDGLAHEVIRSALDGRVRLNHMPHSVPPGGTREWKEGRLRPDLVVPNHLIPGMSRADLARLLQARRPGLPVLLISGYVLKSGDADLPRLAKPFRVSELAAAIARLLGQSAA